MLSKPVESAYGCYEDYALAALGYALVSGHFVEANCSGCSGGVRADRIELVVGTAGGGGACALLDAGSGAGGGSGDEGTGRSSVWGSSSSVGDPVGSVHAGVGSVGRNDSANASATGENGREAVGSPKLRNDGLGSVEVSIKTLENRKKRIKRKERKIKRQAMNVDWRCHSSREGKMNDSVSCVGVDRLGRFGYSKEVRDSLNEKWVAKNKLEAFRANRRLQVLEANKLDDEVQCYRTKVRSQTEKNMVSIEKTHAQLAATDNVPGFAETVVGSEPALTGGSISPSSSISQAEIQELHRKYNDSLMEIENLKLGIASLGLSPESLQAYMEKRDTFTDNTEGERIFSELAGDRAVAVHEVFVDGVRKWKLGADPDIGVR